MKRDSSRDLYAELGLGYIPRILALVDRNPLSPTYGCFDKSYWHYKTSDFPSGMYQECVLPLALAYKYKLPKGDKYYQAERLKELVEAGIEFAASSSHSDGSTDDYYPYEKALGASCFSLYGCTESYIEMELENPRAVDFFLKRGVWLLGNQETGRLSNHQAHEKKPFHPQYMTSFQLRRLLKTYHQSEPQLEIQQTTFQTRRGKS